MAETIKIGGELESMATGKIVAAASAILDKLKNKTQELINQENTSGIQTNAEDILNLNAVVASLQQLIDAATITGGTVANAAEVFVAAIAGLNANNVQAALGELNTRTTFPMIKPNSNTYVTNASEVGYGEGSVACGLIYDISIAHAVSNVPAQYESLSAAIGTNGVNVPQDVRRGGMSVKFINSGTGKYEQMVLKASSFSTDVSDWIDITALSIKDSSANLDIADEVGYVLVRFADGHILTKYFNSANAATKDVVTISANGLMSFSDKKKLNGIEPNAEVNDVVTSTSESDLDITDENNNVLVRFKDGHIQVKNFKSEDILDSVQAILSNIGFDNVPEFDEDENYSVGDVVRHGKYVYVFTASHTAGEWDDTDVERTTTIPDFPIDLASSDADLSIQDEQGNVLAIFRDGKFRTKNFNPDSLPSEGEAPYADFEINDAVGNCILRIINGHIHTKNFKSEDIPTPEPSIQKKKIKILAVGNSYARDAYSYLPYLINSIVNDIEITIGIMFQGSCTLQTHWDNIQNSTALYQYDKWEESVGTWVTVSSKTFQNIVEDEDWDIITFQQQSSRSRFYSTFQPYLNNIIDWLPSHLSKSVKLGWLLTPAYPTGYSDLGDDTSDQMFAKICTAAQEVLSKTAIDFVIPAGTAIQNARTTSLDELGDFGHLSYEGLHLQEGIPCLLEAYVVARILLDITGYGDRGILGNDVEPTQTNVVAWHVPQRDGSSVGVTAANLLLSQKVATMAIKKPYEITDCGTLFES